MSLKKTASRDLLVVPVVGDEPMEGWLEVLNPIIYPPQDAGHRSSPAPGCPAFGYDSVLDRGYSHELTATFARQFRAVVAKLHSSDAF